jgi:60 kDa SS-A/Ro ribonucleoprotein
MQQWNVFRKRNRTAKMICIDIQPYGTTQAKESTDLINVGGFSDQVFRLIADVASGRFSEGHWVPEIEKDSVQFGRQWGSGWSNNIGFPLSTLRS